MVIFYEMNGTKKKTSCSNEDLEFAIVDHANRYILNVKALKDIKLLDARIDFEYSFSSKDLYFMNGFQSWTDTKERRIYEVEKNIKKSPHIITKMFAMDKYGDNHFYKYSLRTLHGFDVFYVKGHKEKFIYNINYNNAYLIIDLLKTRRKIRLTSDVDNMFIKAGDSQTVFDFKHFDSYEEGLNNFYTDFKKLNKKKMFGYSSWYNYYQDINEDIILRDLDALDDRFDLFQIDDGYETFVGDWLDIDSKKFPNGLGEIVNKVHSKKMLAGIWLAPFVAEEKSKLFRERKDLFKRDEKGQFFKCGGNWSGFYALDLENKDAQEYIKESFKKYKDLGFDYFKLDFLYAATRPLYDGLTRAQVSAKYYKFLREIIGEDKIIDGCGASIMHSYNNFDYLRVGPDVSLKFNDVWFMKFFHRERISTKITLQNTIYRSIFNDHLFGNDPDVFLLRDNNIDLSLRQRQAIITIASLFGNLLITSDDIATYDDAKKKMLEEAFDLYKNATNKRFVSRGKEIDIYYTLNNKENKLTYLTRKGVFK